MTFLKCPRNVSWWMEFPVRGLRNRGVSSLVETCNQTGWLNWWKWSSVLLICHPLITDVRLPRFVSRPILMMPRSVVLPLGSVYSSYLTSPYLSRRVSWFLLPLCHWKKIKLTNAFRYHQRSRSSISSVHDSSRYSYLSSASLKATQSSPVNAGFASALKSFTWRCRLMSLGLRLASNESSSSVNQARKFSRVVMSLLSVLVEIPLLEW